MKTIKTIFDVIIVIAMILATLCGCNEIKRAQYDIEVNEVEINEEAENNEGEEYCSGLIEPLEIRTGGDISFKDAFLKEIEISRTIGIENENYGWYSLNKVSDIKEFYFPNVEIDGFELFSIGVSEHGINYYYAPTEALKSGEEYWFNYRSGIEIMTTRSGWVRNGGDHFEFLITQVQGQGPVYLPDDDVIYDEGYKGCGYKRISTRLCNSDKVLRIIAPDKQYTYEAIRDLAFKVIETAELVVVEGER